MSSLFLRLPSFATDYSGFMSLMQGLGGLMILHDPSGCMGNYTNCDEPRWYHDPQPAFSSTLRELEAVVGDQSILVGKAIRAARRLTPKFICILLTPVPSLIGCDIEAAAREIEKETAIPCFGIATTGFRFYDDGIRRALELLYCRFADIKAEKRSKTVNVLGMTPLDYFINGEKEKLEALIAECCWTVNCFAGMGDSLEAVKNLRSAEKNLVMSTAALPLARKMRERDGIPYWIGPPCGDCGISSLKAFLRDAPYIDAAAKTGNGKVLIVGEQACANALRRSLTHEYGCGSITIASFFELDSDEAEPRDIHISNEEHIKEIIHCGDFDTVIGDPLLKPLCGQKQCFIPRPHPAVSSKLHWNDYVSLIG